MNAELDELLSAWLDGGDEAAGRRLQETLRASPMARAAYWQAMQVHAGLRGALRARQAAASGVQQRQRRRVLRARPSYARTGWSLLAAGVLVAIGTLVVWPQPRALPVVEAVSAMPSVPSVPAAPAAPAAPAVIATIVDGPAALRDRTIPAGGRVVAEQRLVLALVGEATRLELEPGTAVTLDRPTGLRIAVERGVLAVSAAPQAANRPLMVVTPQAEVRVVGTVFQVKVGAVTEVSVDQGTVVVRAQQAECAVSAGESARCAAGEAPVRIARMTRLIDEFTAGVAAWNNDSPLGCSLAATDDGYLDQRACRLRLTPTPALANPWAGMRFAKPQDWRDGLGLTLALRGNGRGASILVEILDDGPQAPLGDQDRAERFQVVIVDNFMGWRELRLPFSQFQRRPMQFPGAPNDGFTRSAVQGLSLIAVGGAVDVVVDRIGIYRE